MYRVSREEALSLSIEKDYSVPDDPLDHLQTLWKSVIDGTDHLFEWTARRPHEGSIFDAEFFLTKINMEGKDLILATVRDITERKQAEARLQESEKTYRNLVDNAVVGVYKSRLSGEIFYINNTFLHMLGFDSGHEMGPSGSASTYKNPGDRARLIGMIKEEGSVSGYEVQLLTKDGEPIDVLLSATLEGDVISGMVIDITERKRAEDELKDKTTALQDTNTALRVLLDQREDDKREMEKKYESNVRDLILPHFEDMMNTELTPRQHASVQAIAANLNAIASPLVNSLRHKYASFTPTEIEVANQIRAGLTVKEIAVKLGVSESAANVHRQHVRNKLGLKNAKRNLRTYLMSLED